MTTPNYLTHDISDQTLLRCADQIPTLYKRLKRELASRLFDRADDCLETRMARLESAKARVEAITPESQRGPRLTSAQIKAQERLAAFRYAVNELELPLSLKSIQAALVPQAWSASYVRDQLREVAVCRSEADGLYLWHRKPEVQVPGQVEVQVSPESSEAANTAPAVQADDTAQAA